MAILAARQSKIPIKKIIKIIKKIQPVNGRMEQIGVLKNNAKVILDYAHTPDALEKILKSLSTGSIKPILLFGCGGDRDRTKRKMMANIAKKYASKIYVTDDNPRNENPALIRKNIIRYSCFIFYTIWSASFKIP